MSRKAEHPKLDRKNTYHMTFRSSGPDSITMDFKAKEIPGIPDGLYECIKDLEDIQDKRDVERVDIARHCSDAPQPNTYVD